jgi:hypothetical protein
VVGYLESRRACGERQRDSSRRRTAATLEPAGELDAGDTGGNMSEEQTLRPVFFDASGVPSGRTARSDDDFSEDDDYDVADEDEDDEDDEDEDLDEDDEDLDDEEEDDLDEDEEEDDEEEDDDEDLIDEDEEDDEDLDEEE